jgi:peptidoglycan/LPS O-acetylase OafA/YrhL
MMEAQPRFLFLHAATSRSHGLDTLRSVAILAVIAFHLWAFHGQTVPDAALPFVRIGWMGVDLFFVLSGYLIASQLLRHYSAGKRPSLWQFYRNRLYRVLPAFFVVLGLYLFVPAWRETEALAPAWQYATFTFNLFADHPAWMGFSHVWSLCVEEHFYLFLPLIVWAAMRRPSLRRCVTLVSGFVLCGVAVRAWFLFHLLRPLADQDDFGQAFMRHIYYPTYSRLDGLLAGVSLALIKTFRPAWWAQIARRGHTLLLFGLALATGAVLLFDDRHPASTGTSVPGVLFGFPLLALALACLVASALSANGWLRLRIPGVQLCATLAYCLYLTQKQMLHLVDAWFPRLENASRPAWLLVYLAVCFAVAGALHLCVERPFLILRDRRRGLSMAGSDIKVQTRFPLIPEPAGEDQNAV